MSRTIPEEIVGVPLFIPTANDFFSIETAGLPNGDDCLKVLGATNRDYKAYQDVQTVTPAVFTSRAPGAAWSMVFWFKGADLSTGSGVKYNDQIILGAMNSTWAGISTLAASDQHLLWNVSHYASASGAKTGIGFTVPWDQYNPVQENVVTMGADITANTWTMITFTFPATPGGTMSMYINNSVSAASTAGRSTNAPIAVGAGMKFGIGAYSDQSGVNGRDGDYYLGKLSFHNHQLNATERAILYNAMTT